MAKISFFWFRRDLRIEDNAGLYHALKGPYPVVPIFIFDKNILENLTDKADARVEFIYKKIAEINQSLIEKGSSILVEIGKPEKVFLKLLEKFDVGHVYTNHDYEPYALERDQHVGKLLNSKGIEFHTYKDQVIFEKEEILNLSSSPYKVYTHYKNKWKEKFEMKLTDPFPSDKQQNFFKTTFRIPDLKEVGFKPSAITIPPLTISKAELKKYHETRDFPYLNSTSRIGIHLRFGTISIRKVVKAAYALNETWLNELIWREFFMQLLFNFPYVVTEPFNRSFLKLDWRHDEADFHKWTEGKTGYPLVDAGMRELNQTGFMHNRVRMVCASFLTKHLLIDWRWGEHYFADKLLDFELSSNNGNWQWSAGTGADAQPFFRIFNPMMQQKRFDPEFIYIKKWVPEFGSAFYPTPMVDHKSAVERAKKAFNVLKEF